MGTQTQPAPDPASHIPYRTIIDYQNTCGNGYRYDNTDSFYEYYERLHLLNMGRWNGKWRNEEQERLIDRLNVFDSITSQLELNDHQKAWVKPRFKRISLRPYTKIGGIHIVCFCLCALACRHDGRYYHPSRSCDNNDPEFVRFANNVDFSNRHLHKSYGKVKAAIED